MLKTYFHRECSSEMISCTINLLNRIDGSFLNKHVVPSLPIIACVKQHCLKKSLNMDRDIETLTISISGGTGIEAQINKL